MNNAFSNKRQAADDDNDIVDNDSRMRLIKWQRTSISIMQFTLFYIFCKYDNNNYNKYQYI